MGCLLTNRWLGHEVAMPRGLAAQVLVVASAEAALRAGDRWQRELAAWLAEHARAIAAGGEGFDVGDLAWTPDHFPEQQRFALEVVGAASRAHRGDLRVGLDRLADLVAGHRRHWVVVGRRWAWPDRAPRLP